jgi:hypothetical protein
LINSHRADDSRNPAESMARIHILEVIVIESAQELRRCVRNSVSPCPVRRHDTRRASGFSDD